MKTLAHALEESLALRRALGFKMDDSSKSSYTLPRVIQVAEISPQVDHYGQSDPSPTL